MWPWCNPCPRFPVLYQAPFPFYLMSHHHPGWLQRSWGKLATTAYSFASTVASTVKHIRLLHKTEVCDLKPPYSFLRTSISALLAQDHACLPQPSSIWWPLPPPGFILRLPDPKYILTSSQLFSWLPWPPSFSYTCMADLQTRARDFTTQLLYSFTVSIEFNPEKIIKPWWKPLYIYGLSPQQWPHSQNSHSIPDGLLPSKPNGFLLTSLYSLPW